MGGDIDWAALAILLPLHRVQDTEAVIELLTHIRATARETAEQLRSRKA